MIRELWRRKAMVGAVMVVALLVALLTSYKLPSFQKRSVSFGGASSQILIDSPQSTLVAGAQDGTLTTLYTRAQIFAQYLSSPEARVKIAAASGIPVQRITASGPFSQDAQRTNYNPQATAQRSNSILNESAPNRLVFAAQQDVPIITVSVQSPAQGDAVKLANASFVALKSYVAELNRTNSTGPRRNPVTGLPFPATGVTVRNLGTPESGTIGGGNSKLMMIFVFLAVTLVGCAAILTVPGVLRNWRLLDEIDKLESFPATLGDPLDGADPAREREGGRRGAPADGQRRAPGEASGRRHRAPVRASSDA